VKGIIFNELQKMVTVSLGADAWEALLEQTPLETEGGGFIGPQTYPDKDLFALVGTASRVTGKPVDELVRSFGKFLFPDLARLYPGFLKPGMTAKSFLTTVHDVIHVEVRKLHPDVELPRFRYEDPAPNQLVMCTTRPASCASSPSASSRASPITSTRRSRWSRRSARSAAIPCAGWS